MEHVRSEIFIFPQIAQMTTDFCSELKLHNRDLTEIIYGKLMIIHVNIKQEFPEIIHTLVRNFYFQQQLHLNKTKQAVLEIPSDSMSLMTF